MMPENSPNKEENPARFGRTTDRQPLRNKDRDAYPESSVNRVIGSAIDRARREEREEREATCSRGRD